MATGKSDSLYAALKCIASQTLHSCAVIGSHSISLQPLSPALPSVDVLLRCGHAADSRQPEGDAGANAAFLAAVCLNAMQHCYELPKVMRILRMHSKFFLSVPDYIVGCVNHACSACCRCTKAGPRYMAIR